jgi:hypothetical protein
MSTAAAGSHTLVVYQPSERADAALRQVAEEAAESGGRITVLTLMAQEPEGRGCCDTRSVLWNDVCRGLARDDLSTARLAVEGNEAVDLGVLPFSGRGAARAVIREAVDREADAIVLADPRAIPLGPLERRRLRRGSPVPVLS